MAERAAARTFHDLIVWRKAHELVIETYRFSSGLPKSETYGLALQMRRAAVSIPANIAEGFKRRGKANEVSRLLHIYGCSILNSVSCILSSS